MLNSDHLMKPTVAIFGDCVLHSGCKEFNHTIAFGLTNWLSINSKTNEFLRKITDEFLNKNTKLTNYEKRVCFYNFNKGILEYIFSKKADYFIFDCNDNRKGILKDAKSESIVTDFSNIVDFNKIIEYAYGGKYFFEHKNSYDIDFTYYKNAISLFCTNILRCYKESEIIYVQHNFTKCYVENKDLHQYLNNSRNLNSKSQKLIKDIENEILKQLQNIHIIPFPENVLGDGKHPFGIMPLHYHPMYFEYLKKALNIVFLKSNDEKILLDQLRDIYSLKFELLTNELRELSYQKFLNDKIDQILFLGNKFIGDINNQEWKERFVKITNLSNYLDFLNFIKKEVIIIISVKDTCGFYNNPEYLEKIKNIGFKNYPNKLWQTYIGICIKGNINVDIAGGLKDPTSEEKLTVTKKINDITISVESASFTNGNLSRIIINNKDYSNNLRGINIVVINNLDNKILDSVSYDSHIMDYFKRNKLFL